MKYHEFENITKLPSNYIFVFGSNESGIHGKGAALTARKYFGAEYGIGIGLKGQSYAIPTKDGNLKTLDLKTIQAYIKEFLIFVNNNPDKNFIFTKIGCGLAGYKESDIAKILKQELISGDIENLILPLRFIDYMDSTWKKLKLTTKNLY